MPDYAAARLHMVQSQLHPNRVTDPRIFSAMTEVPRERFAPEALRDVACVDEDIAVGPGRYLMEPMVFALLVQAARVGAEDIVLDVGCGTGYSTAVLARLSGTVVALESEADLADRAQALLSQLEIANAVVVSRPLVEGYAEQGPYDVIFVNGSVARLPEALTTQLAEGGRLVAVVRSGRSGTANLVTRRDGLIASRPVFDAATPPLPEFDKRPGFVF